MYAYIFPKSWSVALPRGGRPPQFEVVTDQPLFLAIEVTTDNSLFDTGNKSRRNPAGNLNFYNTFEGLTVPPIQGQSLRTAPNNRTSFSLPNKVWKVFSRHHKIYYRVIVAHLMLRGRPVGVGFISTRDREYKDAPYIHVLLAPVSQYYNRSSSPSSRSKTPWLMVEGNRLIEGNRRRPPQRAGTRPAIVLRGVNFSGLQYRQHNWGTPQGQTSQRWWQAAGITQARIQEIASWGAKIIRLPINQDWVLNGVANKNGIEYLKDIDQIVDWAATEGMYTLLDLQVLDTRTYPPPERTQPMPNNLSLLFWRILAGRYQRDPAVLYDLCNEPHKPKGRKENIYRNKQRGYWPNSGKGWVDLWHEWVRQIEAVIHDVHRDAVIFVSGIGGPCYAASLRSMPVPMQPLHVRNPRPLPNAVYSCHIYYHSQDDGDGVDDSPGKKMGTLNPTHWDYWFGFKRLCEKHPIFIGEFGAEPENLNPNFANLTATQKQKVINDMRKWGTELITYLTKLRQRQGNKWPGLAGWTSWSWGDRPYLVQRQSGQPPTSGDRPYVTVGNRHVPTEFGKLVKDDLGRP